LASDASEIIAGGFGNMKILLGSVGLVAAGVLLSTGKKKRSYSEYAGPSLLVLGSGVILLS
jgi:hypothetical protein